MATRIIPKTELRDRIREELDDLRDDTLMVTNRSVSASKAESVFAALLRIGD